MRHTEIIPQVDGALRYLYECPRGIIAIDQYRDGTSEITRCLGGRALTSRDVREAKGLHESVLADEDDEERFRLSEDDACDDGRDDDDLEARR